MMFKGLRSKASRKKFLGAIVIVAFVALISLVATRYIIISRINLTVASLASVLIIVALLLYIELPLRRSKGPKKRSRKKRR